MYNAVLGGAQWVLVIVMWGCVPYRQCTYYLIGCPSITVQSGGEVPPSLCRVEVRSLHHCAEWR